MLSPQERETIRQMHAKKVSIKDICRLMKLSRNTVRKVLRDDGATGSKESKHLEHLGLIKDLLHRCRGNVVRVRECLEDEHGISIPYTTLTWLVRSFELAEPKKKRSGRYVFAKGEEMQHDTSPFKLMLGSSKVQTQCASLVLAYSRKLYIQFYPRFTRFEAKVFLTRAFGFMQGVCPRCVVDNTSVLVSVGTGPDAVIAPEMEALGRFFQVVFIPHRVGDANRKARVERPFDYISRNFLAGRTFADFQDLNTQALVWCETVANAKIKRALGMSANEAYLLEKPALIPLPEHVPEVFDLVYRVVDSEGYVHLNTNRYSVPEKLVGTKVEVYKFWDRVEIYAGHTKVARHPRALKPGRCRVSDPAHHPPIKRKISGPCQEEQLLTGHSRVLDSYVAGLRKRSRGRGVQPLHRLLTLKRTYPEQSFFKAVERAEHYHLYDLRRLEDLILSMVAGDFFDL